MEFLTGKILAFLLVATRVGAFFAIAPVFSWQAIPQNIKIAMTVVAAIFFGSTMGYPAECADINVIEGIVLLGQELIYGAALGLVANVIFAVVKIAGRIIERQMGMALAAVINPLDQDQAQPVAMLVEMIFVLLFFNINGHHTLLETLAQSYETYPMTSIPEIGQMLTMVTMASGKMLLLALKLAAPIVAAFLLIMVILGILARLVPEMNIFITALPIRVGSGIAMLAVFIPFILDYVHRFATWMDKFLPL